MYFFTKELLVLIGEYALRCPTCFGCFVTNKCCTNANQPYHLNLISTFQIIPSAEDNTLPVKCRGLMESNYDNNHEVIEKFQRCKSQTFLVIHVEQSGYFGADFIKLIFGKCVDHWCYRKVKDYLGVFYSTRTKKWRWLTLAEARCRVDETLAKHIHKTFQQKLSHCKQVHKELV